MPTYDYYCNTCEQELEVFQSMKDPPLTHCDCGKKGKVKRMIGTGAGLIFKGSGFYETDYKRSGQKPAEGSADAAAQTPAAPANKATADTAKTTKTADAS